MNIPKDVRFKIDNYVEGPKQVMEFIPVSGDKDKRYYRGVAIVAASQGRAIPLDFIIPDATNLKDAFDKFEQGLDKKKEEIIKRQRIVTPGDSRYPVPDQAKEIK